MSATVYIIEHGDHGEYSLGSEKRTPAAVCLLEYLDEGGANFVFRIRSTDGTCLPTQLQRKLLRLRKDLPHVPTAEEQLRALNDDFRDLFPPEYIVQHDLIHLSPGVLSLLNDLLRKSTRPSHRMADWLSAQETTGLLVTDMTPVVGEVTIQLKPKWLAQSPSAPDASRRCRTCAVRAQRASRQVRTATDAQELCPLDLINDDVQARRRAIALVTADEELSEHLLSSAQTLLHQLRISQVVFDPYGTLKASDANSIHNLCKAMTLRDCTLFLKRSGHAMEARLGDLDLKQPEKLSKWKEVESDLIECGWYSNTESEAVWHKETTCLLSRYQHLESHSSRLSRERSDRHCVLAANTITQ